MDITSLNSAVPLAAVIGGVIFACVRSVNASRARAAAKSAAQSDAGLRVTTAE
jgi:hypothetical protein